MTTIHPGYRVFVLGAGFSRLAGLPLANELYKKVRQNIEFHHGLDTKFHRDISNYIEYERACGRVMFEQDVDLERFMSFLDIEHFLRLRGSDTWSSEGNETQLMIRRSIGEVIHQHTPIISSLPDEYFKFAENISVTDTFITLNYDTILEQLLDYTGKPYRLFPDRYKEVHATGCVVDSDVKEVVIMKLHGSIDWFHDKAFLDSQEYLASLGMQPSNRHTVFGNPGRFKVEPLVEGIRPEKDPLAHIHRIRDVDGFYGQPNRLDAPFILSPSHVKFVYAEPLLDLWYGLGQLGGYERGISVIGFSLPEHDEYIRVLLYQIISNYQQSWWEDKLFDVLKDDIKFVDFRASEESIIQFRKNFSFVDESRAQFFYQGFNEQAVDFLFNPKLPR
ncbi:SIR2-like domain-containing protein [Thalassospira xiamenensis M-5 = DSM 17429]|uniref:SIR2-like domain-containing protein n=1 Tax=Thalassospira xiamenensis M-5 = DSM 17429 TaxID=1123366 RepID=A0AB72UJK8_9PROT|nr:SIR2 family protein [Thalassospira xiamenensis]AJD54345.1 hypothetical protein TH3_21363 [Thalassospira xiamenensis M-5 = DSM 17429]SIT21364.1 SIR2-like domain-containing protein [Thalassospira xiamenensis M-5 = DSM 17429]